MELKTDRVYREYYLKDNNKRADKPFFYFKENHLDFGKVPASLPKLEPAEEMVIIRVYISVNIFIVYWFIYFLSFSSVLFFSGVYIFLNSFFLGSRLTV